MSALADWPEARESKLIGSVWKVRPEFEDQVPEIYHRIRIAGVLEISADLGVDLTFESADRFSSVDSAAPDWVADVYEPDFPRDSVLERLDARFRAITEAAS
jgi:hypothetical protein